MNFGVFPLDIVKINYYIYVFLWKMFLYYHEFCI